MHAIYRTNNDMIHWCENNWHANISYHQMLGSLPIRTHPGPSLATPGMQGPSVSIQPLYPYSSSSNLHQFVHSVFPDFCCFLWINTFLFIYFSKFCFSFFIFSLTSFLFCLDVFGSFSIELAVLSLRTRSVTLTFFIV